MNDLIQIPDSTWESIIKITNKIQREILSAQSFKDLLLMLRDKGLPVPLNEISVIYQKYGSAKPIFLVKSGEIINKNAVHSDIEFSADLPAITEIMNNSNEHTYLATQKECTQKGFPNQYKSLLLIPLKISDIRNIGIFIVHSSSEENAYEHLVKPLTALSNRLAFYLYINFITRRSNSFRSFKNELLQTNFHQEHEIIEFLLNQLKKWFSIDKINILLIDPFNIDQYFYACKDSIPIRDYRSIKQGIDDNSVIKKFINYLENTNQSESKSNYKSWLGAKMAIVSDQNVGYIILENQPTNTYSDWEKELINDIASFVALFLTEFRKSLREESIIEVKNLLLANTLPSDKQLYQKAQDELNKLYGSVPLAIVRVNRTTRNLELTDTTIQDFSLDGDFTRTLSNHIETTGKLNINELAADELKNRLTIDHPNLGRLIAAPMRSGGDELGCFIVPAPNCGPLTARYIDELSDMIATIMDKQDKQNLRLDLILEFGNEVAKISNITKEEIIKTTQTYISKAMYSENLYIALYDKQKNEVSFPYIVKNGKPWNQSPRLLDQKKRGKTEEIIITKLPILHKTKQESRSWYDEPNHEEFAGNALASWIGVPIITPEGVIGVIATYHPDKESAYSQGDLFFLQMLALQASGLFRVLALEEANHKLEEAIDNNTELKEANRQLKEAKHKEAETANTISQLQEKTRHLTLKETDGIRDDLVDALLCTNSINHSINRAINNDDINHLKTGMGITTINNARELIKNSIDRLESLQKTNDNNQVDISIDSIIHESYYNALNYVFDGTDKPILEKQATNDVKIFAIKRDIDLIFFAIFSGILNLLKNLDFNLKYEFSEDNEVIFIQIGAEVDNDIFILNEIDDEANIRAAKQLIQLKFTNSSISRSSSGEVIIKLSSNTKKVKIYLAISISSLEENLKHQINFIYKSRKENVIYTEDVEELGQTIITDDESKALSIANKGKKVFLITKGDSINNTTQSNIIYLSRNKIAMDDVMDGGTYLVNFLL